MKWVDYIHLVEEDAKQLVLSNPNEYSSDDWDLFSNKLAKDLFDYYAKSLWSTCKREKLFPAMLDKGFLVCLNHMYLEEEFINCWKMWDWAKMDFIIKVCAMHMSRPILNLHAWFEEYFSNRKND